jgi:hypothetical protein
MTLSGIIQVTEYSDASVAMFGNTTEYKEHIKAMGGRFNARLRHPTTKEPTPGWIFPKRSTEMLNKYVEVGDTDDFDITKHCKEYGVRNSSSDQDKSGVSHIEFNNLVNRVNELEQIVQKLSEKLAINSKTNSSESNSSESNSSESKPQLRLLRRNK